MPDSVKKNVFSFLLGLVLFAGLLYWIRATTVMEHLSQVGPWIAVVILGYGLVNGRKVGIVANDFTVLASSNGMSDRAT